MPVLLYLYIDGRVTAGKFVVVEYVPFFFFTVALPMRSSTTFYSHNTASVGIRRILAHLACRVSRF